MVVVDVQTSLMTDSEGRVLADFDDNFMVDLGIPTSMWPSLDAADDVSMDFEICMKQSLKSLQISSTILDPVQDITDFERKIAMIYDHPDENPDLASISQEIDLGKRKRSLSESISEESFGIFNCHKFDHSTSESEYTPSESKLSSLSESPNSYLVHSRRGFSTQTIEITLEMLQQRFHLSLEAAASEMGIGKSTMKTICRTFGIPKWPYTHKGKKRRQTFNISNQQIDTAYDGTLLPGDITYRYDLLSSGQ
uniref:RWP-RK domain-containing protein n=1 Tax=Hanusia phi TaxID=3032 RepID=A0A7S0E063_9CRYP|mmetsp:Transcript_13343/g.30712  ORF Transcript_13343/g.30712 Transcript_13343/m.30712 type:complete len:252 (+) Transcript_13343:19-774(+)|eukprot:485136-Hanusia_phi.AAC.1